MANLEAATNLDIFLGEGKITAEQYKNILKIGGVSGKAIDQVLMESGLASALEIARSSGKLSQIKSTLLGILSLAVTSRATDIHIEPQGSLARVRYRVNGSLHHSHNLSSQVADGVVFRIKALSNLRLDETRIFQEGRLQETLDKKITGFRVSVLPSNGGEKVVLSLEDSHQTQVLNLEKLGLNIKKSRGLILFCNPIGDKPMAAFAMDTINSAESAERSLHAALTGNLVFSSIHANNALRAISRLLGLRVPPFLLASALNAVVTLRQGSVSETLIINDTLRKKIAEERNIQF